MKLWNPAFIAATTCLSLGVATIPPFAMSSLPSFPRTLLLETTSETSANASFGDVNGDGILDVVLAKGRHWPLVDRVLLGDGKGGIQTAYDLGTASDKSYASRLVDLDGDGDLDVVVSNDTPNPKLIYHNDGRGHFAVAGTFGKPEWQTRNATVADVNLDGHPDIIVANRVGRGPGANYICLNDGKGRFDAPCIAFSPEPATTITVADFNRDGFVDFVVPHRNGGQGHVYFGSAEGDFTKLRSEPFGPADGTIRTAEAADFDGDGVLDLVAIDERRGSAIYFGRREGGFAAGVPLGDPSVAPYALAVGDLNGDQKMDIVAGHVKAPTIVYVNDGAGRGFVPVSVGDSLGTAYGIDIADFDGDRKPDLAVARSEAPNVLYLTRPEHRTSSTKGSRRPAGVEALIAQWNTVNSSCRGGNPEAAATVAACKKRDGANNPGLRLNARGWCYGMQDEAGYQYQWHRCTKLSLRFPKPKA